MPKTGTLQDFSAGNEWKLRIIQSADLNFFFEKHFGLWKKKKLQISVNSNSFMVAINPAKLLV